jgi:hypothetical protein
VVRNGNTENSHREESSLTGRLIGEVMKILNNRDLKYKWCVILILSIFFHSACSNVSREVKLSQEGNNRIQWWLDAKFGMFIHWGIYSVPAGTWNEQKTMGNAEWIMHSLEIPITEYEKFAMGVPPGNGCSPVCRLK